jgi:SEC-C motif domain protein
MDTRNGDIRTAEQVAVMTADDQKFFKPITTELTRVQRRTMKIGRNHPCPCGSGKKFKACCLVGV